MGKPRFMAENLFNAVQFGSHHVSGNEEAVGNEAWRVADGRRSARDYWTPTTANQDAWVEVECNRMRAADMIALDRGHNLGGHTVELHGSYQDDFSTYTTIFSVTIPSKVHYPGRLDETPGVRTPEGAWLYKFPVQSFQNWRVYVPAMGSGLLPKIVGAFLGLSWQPEYYLDLPFDDEGVETVFGEVQSDTAWSASTRPTERRRGTVSMKLSSADELPLARYHIIQNFFRRRPMWIVFDDEDATKAVLAIVPSGSRTSFPQRAGWFNRQGEFEWVEQEPKLI